MKPPPDGLVSGVRTATANQPAQNGGKTRRLTAKRGSTRAKTAQNAKGELQEGVFKDEKSGKNVCTNVHIAPVAGENVNEHIGYNAHHETVRYAA